MAKNSIRDLIDKHVGSRVRMRRLMLGVSQQKLAGRLGITFQQVQKYESGANRIGASRLQAISTVLETPVQFFFEGSPGVLKGAAPPLPSDFADFFATTDGLKLAGAFTQIGSAEVRRSVVRLVEGIAGESDS